MNRFLLITFIAISFFAKGFSQVSIVPTITDVSCSGVCSGSIVLQIVAGMPPYNFKWSNTDTTRDLSNLCAGTYTVTVTDLFGDSTVQAFNILQPAPIVASPNVINATCAGASNGQIFLSVSGGVQPFAFNWSIGTTTPNINNVPAGIYNVTITDAQGCNLTTSAIVMESSAITTQVNVINPNCTLSNGTIVVNASSGIPPYNFSLNAGNPQSSNTFSALSSGIYTIRVSDSLGCAKDVTVDLFRVSLLVDKIVPANCSNQGGQVTMKAIGGNPPYTYNWSIGATGQVANNLASGGYSVTVTDSTGCSRHVVVQVPLDAACIGTVVGKVFFDLDNDCVNDTTEAPASFRQVTINSAGGSIAVTTDVEGYFSHTLPLGTYTIEPFANQLQAVACPPGGKRQVNLTTAGMTIDGLDFGLQSFPVQDVGVRAFGGIARPGFTSNLWVTLTNNSTIAGISKGEAVLTLDNRTTPTNTTGQGVISGNTITWNYNLAQGATETFYINMQIAPPPTVNLNDILIHAVKIFPTTTDSFSNNNLDTIRQNVQGSYDPNDKAVFPSGNILAKDTVLFYTIRFQNTGTDTAFFVIIRDTLDININPYTFRNFSSSHPMTPVFVANDVIEFRFADIYLPDSFVNEPASHGFVSFYVNRYKNIPVGTTISNSASIYFDYNLPIKTNTVVNTLVNPVSNIQAISKNEIKIYPNPAFDRLFIATPQDQFKNASLFDLNGAIVAESSYPELSVLGLPQGLYVCKVLLNDNTLHYVKIAVK